MARGEDGFCPRFAATYEPCCASEASQRVQARASRGADGIAKPFCTFCPLPLPVRQSAPTPTRTRWWIRCIFSSAMRLQLAKRLSGPRQPFTETLQFLRAVLRHPSRVGAVAPSGRMLARLMTDSLTAADAPILELGPGTGIFTKA